MGSGHDLLNVGMDALRWVQSRCVPLPGGQGVPASDEGGAEGDILDDLYAGTAGVLITLAQARLLGIRQFDDFASAVAGRLCFVAAAAASEVDAPLDLEQRDELGLYSGLAGIAAALRVWADVTSQDASARAAAAAIQVLTRRALSGAKLSKWRDIISGDAGILLALAASSAAGARDSEVLGAISTIADRLIREAVPQTGGVDWRCNDDTEQFMPNFSHGGAGVGFALAAAHLTAGTPGALAAAQQAASRLTALGLREDGTFAAPDLVPPKESGSRIAYGWCHGPSGTVRLFSLLAIIDPAQRWEQVADGCRAAVRVSGLPERVTPGFWDNIGTCCGTAGVGNMALDQYQQANDRRWLEWADELAADILSRKTSDATGTRWSHTDYTSNPSLLPPTAGYMQGAAGISVFLLRLHHLHRDGPSAPTLRLPDHARTFR